MISVIIPFHNEEANLEPLCGELTDELKKIRQEYEIILVDDGSTDGGGEKLNRLARTTAGIKPLILNKQFGKGTALAEGLAKAEGQTIIFMDADLQDNPAAIPQFLDKLNEGYDLVNGVRKSRSHNSLIIFYSKLGNGFLRRFAHSPFTDINCGFKVFRKTVLKEAVLYANNFRFLPLAAYQHGFRVTEIPVDNRPRLHGKSKFGIGKAFIGLFDVITVYFLFQFAERPLHFFGLIGGTLFTAGFAWALVLSVQRLFFGVLLYRRPALQLAVLLIIVGLQIIMTGIIGELIVYLDKKRQNQA